MKLVRGGKVSEIMGYFTIEINGGFDLSFTSLTELIVTSVSRGWPKAAVLLQCSVSFKTLKIN